MNAEAETIPEESEMLNVTALFDTTASNPAPPANVIVSPPATVSVPVSPAKPKLVATATVPAAVNLPCASTVNVGIAVVEPYDPAVTVVFAILAAVTWSSAM